MFKSLTIKNFKSHEDTKIEFDSGVNVIQGLSFTGKTNVLRALRLLLENRPQGAHYFSDFAGDKGITEIGLELFDKTAVTLEKSIHINKKGEKVLDGSIYQITGSKLLENDWSSAAPSSGIPDQIDQVLNMSELNMQKQFDQPFLVSSSSGEVARIVNKITKLENVDEWISDVTSQINQSQRDVNRLSGEVEFEILVLKKYDGIEETKKIIQRLEKIDADLKNLQRRFLLLDKTLMQLEETYKKIDKLQEYLLAERYIKKAEALEKNIAIQADFQVRIKNWQLYVSLIEKHEKSLLELKILVDKLDSIDLQTLVFNHDGLKKKLSIFESLLDKVKEFDLDIQNNKEKYVALVKDSKICPICFSVIDEQQLRKIEEAL